MIQAPELQTAPRLALIVEDDWEMRRWLADVLQAVFPAIRLKQVATAAQARAALERTTFDLALVDLSLPDGSGVDILSRLNQDMPNCMSIVVTVFEDDQHLFPALQAGAGGYLLKHMPRAQFIQRLRGMISGEPPLSPAIARRLLQHFGQPQKQPEHGLTAREQEVLVLIAKGVTLAEVAQALSISPHTAGDHVKNIYRKLNISSRAEATLEAARLGFISPH